MKKETRNQIIIIVILSVILTLLLFILYGRNNIGRFNPMNDEVEKDLKLEDVDKGTVVNKKRINLSNYNSNITITEGGEYTLSGRFTYSLLVDSKDKVILNLSNIYIESTKTAAIANIGTGDLVINLVDGSENVLKDNGSSELDGALYSSGKLFIEGNGILKVYGLQEEGEGIATTDNDITINGGNIYIESNDDGINAGGDNGGVITINNGSIYVKASGDGIDSNGSIIINGGSVYSMGSSQGGDAGIDADKEFIINGGQVIALGSDMLQNPSNNSKQKYVSFNLNSKINLGSIISLKDVNGNEVITFTADEAFKTLIISNSTLNNGTYYLYIDGRITDYGALIK